MSKYIILLSLLFLPFGLNAQNQQGIVKTRGRVVNGQVLAGQRLTGATIILNIGNPLISGQNGEFLFNVPSGKSYSLVAAKKQGFTLADPEYTKRSFSYSAKNPFYVVLEDENQRLADINAATRKVRKTLIAQLEKREEEIEALKAQNKITEREYQERLKQLNDNHSNSEKLVKEMAERYASTDYDQLDEFNRQVQMLIEEGELQKADSMIRSKGDIEKRTRNYRSVVDANAATRKKLEQSEAGAAKVYEELSQDLFNMYTIAVQQFRWEDAQNCLKQRADLDTNNVQAVWDYVLFVNAQNQYHEARDYCHILLHSLQRMEKKLGEYSAELAYLKCICQFTLGDTYLCLFDYSSSELYLKEALSCITPLYENNPDEYGAEYVGVLARLGAMYREKKDYSLALKVLLMTSRMYLNLYEQDPSTYQDDFASNLVSLGILCNYMQADEASMQYYDLAKHVLEKAFVREPEKYRSQYATLLVTMGGQSVKMDDYPKALKYLHIAVEQTEILYKQNSIAYQEYLAAAYEALSHAYYYSSDFKNGEKFIALALQHQEALYQRIPESYALRLAEMLNMKVYEHYKRKEYDEALKLLERAISIAPDYFNSYDTKGEILLMQGHEQEALALWNKVLQLKPDIFLRYPEGTDLYKGLKKLGLIE